MLFSRKRSPESKRKMKKIILIVAVSASLGHGSMVGDRIDIQTLDGREFSNAKISRIEPDGLMVMTEDGITKVAFENMPQNLRSKFEAGPTEEPASHEAESSQEFTFTDFVETRFDKFHDTFTYRIKFSVPAGVAKKAGAFTVLGINEKKAEFYVLHLTADTDSWSSLDRGEAIFICGKDRWKTDQLEHKSSLHDDGMFFEQLFVTLTPEQFAQVAFSDSVEAKIGTTIFEISDPHRASFRSLISRFNPEAVTKER